MKTKAIALLALLALLLTLGGCGSPAAPNSSSNSTSAGSQPNQTSSQTSLYDRGLELIAQMREMADSHEYLSLYTNNPDVQAVAAEAGAGKGDRPSAVYQITFPGDSALAFYQPEGEESGLSPTLRDTLREQYCSASVFAYTNNAAYGAATVAGFSICTASKVFVYPGLQENALYLYQYAGAVPAAVSFIKGEDDTVSAFGIFVYDGADTLDGLLEQLEEAGGEVKQVGEE